jgi:hypothetical protein
MEISGGQGWGDKEDDGETKSEMKFTHKERQNGEKRVFHALSSKKWPELTEIDDRPSKLYGG